MGYWGQFIKNINQLIENSEHTLKSYYNFWIHGEGKVVSDPRKRMEETGIMDPIEYTSPEDWTKFYSLFPVVYFSFLILTRYKSDSVIIKQIALENPHDCPFFDGYDLWLQRKAFNFCVQKSGVKFILYNYADVRLELICYSLLKKTVRGADLDVLRNYLLSYEHDVMWVDSNLLVEIINSLKSKV